MTRVLLTLSALLMGCQAGPTFDGVESVKIQKVGGGGLYDVPLSVTAQRKAVECLYSTKEVTEQDTQRDMLLQEVYLIEVRDKAGIRSFEMYTSKHLKGNKGKYYQNNCLHGIIGQG